MQDPVFLQKETAYPLPHPCIWKMDARDGLPNGGFGGKEVAVSWGRECRVWFPNASTVPRAVREAALYTHMKGIAIP